MSPQHRGPRVADGPGGDAATRDESARLARVAQGTVVTYWAERIPELPAVISDQGTLTFAELDRRANQLVRALRRRGVGPGASVALCSRNRREWVEVWAAVQRGGYRLTPVNFHLTAREAAYIVTDSEAEALLVDASLGAAAMRDLARLVDRPIVLISIGGSIEGFEPFEDLAPAEDDGPLPDPRPGTQMLYTSGTTGHPKGVDRTGVPPTQGIAIVLAHLFAYRPGDVHLTTGPLYHAAPIAFSLGIPLANGAGVVVMDRWTPEETLRLVEAHGVTHTHVVPTMFVRLLALEPAVRDRYDVSSLRHVLHGAAPCAPAVKERAIDWLGPIVDEYYGATEVGVSTVVDSRTWLAHRGTVGHVDPGEVIVVDDDGEPVPTGTVGTIYVKAPETGRFSYHRDDVKTSRAYRGDHSTVGDVGYLDDEGFLFVTDRSADLVISGGVNIYPAEIDAVLHAHPAVVDAATIGIPDEEWGESVLSIVEVASGVTPCDELARELIEHTRAHLAHYKCPRRIEFVDSLPRTDTGKIKKRELRDERRTGATS